MTRVKESVRVQVRGRFHRSVQISKDWSARDSMADYIVTPAVRALTQWIVDELGREKGIRAWSITGPYGTGKSAFALFLSKLLADQSKDHPEIGALNKRLPKGHKPFLPVLIVGQKASLSHALLAALREAIKKTDSALGKEIERLEKLPNPDDKAVVGVYEKAAETLGKKGYGGLTLIVDEFGKFLEQIATAPGSQDLLVMQHLAEAAARSSVPMVVLTILHTGFTTYLTGDDELQQAEWQKVQGRYQDVAFQEPQEQLLRLVGAAIDTHLDKGLAKRYEQHVEKVVRSEALAESRERLPLHGLLPRCIPLEPIAALLLGPLFRSKLAQNERSLFSFLTSQEPFGFQEFLDKVDWESEDLPLYRLDQLYDYVSTTLGASAYKGNLGRRWAEADDAISRISAHAPPITRSVVKALSLLWIYGRAIGLRANEKTLIQALGEAEGIPEALNYLQRASIVIYRKFEGAFGLWEGSDINLEERYEEARQHIARNGLASRFAKQIELRPLVARAHYIKTGTLRYFTVDVLDGLEGEFKKLFGQRATDPDADGQLVFVLTGDEETRSKLKGLAKSQSKNHPLNILAFPRPFVGLESALEQVECWRWVNVNTPAIEGDKAARAELDANLQDAVRQLERIAGQVFGLRGYRFQPEASEWIQGGKIHRLSDSRDFQHWLSSLCDSVFHSSPPLKNELLNRRKLSSAAKAGLNELIKQMAFNEREERFGIEGTPAEVSMYESFIRGGGFHSQDEGWRIVPPHNPAWQPIWTAVEQFLETTHQGRKPISELHALLKAPPFGVRDGPLPLLLMTALLSKRGEIAIYRDGLYQVGLNKELLELIAHVPELFEVQEFVFDSASKKTLATIQKVITGLGVSMSQREGSPLLWVAEPLIISVSQLPDFSKKTKRLDPIEAVELRGILLKATDPHELLLVKIPSIFGLKLDDRAAEHKLAENLQECLIALYQAYPRLLDKIEGQMKATFSLVGKTTGALRSELMKRADPLDGLASDGDLSRFVNAVSQLDERDWREIVGRVVMGGKPPSVWLDNDLVDFQVRLQQLYSDFVRLEELGLEQRQTGVNQVIRVGVLQSKLKEVRESIPLSDERASEVNELANKISKSLLKFSGEDHRQVRLAALAQLFLQEMQGRES